jgi:hypothetical protein
VQEMRCLSFCGGFSVGFWWGLLLDPTIGVWSCMIMPSDPSDSGFPFNQEYRDPKLITFHLFQPGCVAEATDPRSPRVAKPGPICGPFLLWIVESIPSTSWWKKSQESGWVVQDDITLKCCGSGRRTCSKKSSQRDFMPWTRGGTGFPNFRFGYRGLWKPHNHWFPPQKWLMLYDFHQPPKHQVGWKVFWPCVSTFLQVCYYLEPGHPRKVMRHAAWSSRPGTYVSYTSWAFQSDEQVTATIGDPKSTTARRKMADWRNSLSLDIPGTFFWITLW